MIGTCLVTSITAVRMRRVHSFARGMSESDTGLAAPTALLVLIFTRGTVGALRVC